MAGSTVSSGWSCSMKMNFSKLSVMIMLIAINSCVSQIKDEPLVTFEVLYNAGIEFYAEENWTECLNYMQKAIQDYKLYQNKLIDCRSSCETESGRGQKFFTYEDLTARQNFPALAFFENALRKSNCLRRCKKSKLAGRPESVNAEILAEFDALQPYDYLQICAYKADDLNLAASAAFTFLMANPKHTTMHTNVQFYHTLNVKDEYFYNMEQDKHQELYISGVNSYGKEDFTSTIRDMEASLEDYYVQLQRCSLLCESTYDHESLPDFYNAVADHWANVLRCKQECPSKLATINGAVVENYLVEHYNYLQFAYYQVKELSSAAECTATYLVLRPDDETMTQNKEYYITTEKIPKEDFRPRYEAVQYRDMQKLETEMLGFVDTMYKFSDADEDGGHAEERILLHDEYSGIVDPDKFRNPSYFSTERRDAEGFGVRDEQSYERFTDLVKDLGARVFAREEQLSGKERFVLDDVISEKECGVISELAKFGYGGKDGQHGPQVRWEAYDGLKVDEFKNLIENRTIDLDMADTYLAATDRILKLISAYFNIKWPLYFDFVHTACKNPVLDTAGEPRDEFYQRIHTDNCRFKPGKPCLREYPTRYWREFTSILYLNEVDGGEFVFADGDSNFAHAVSPKCGRLVVFNSSHPHGVRAYKGGKRCTVGLWSTLDPNYADRRIDHTKAAISGIRAVDSNPGLKEFIQKHNIHMNMTEKELNGPERFAADNILTENECDTLIQLANIGGVAGDGYNHGRLSTVNTANEKFAGLTVAAAAELAAKGDLEVSWVEMYMEKAILVKELTRKYFKLEQPLYMDYTHLVCRTSLHEKDKVRTDLSHPVHSDNCIIQTDNSCKKAPPAYTQRDYSALLYLNENFTGGDFIFTHQNMTIQTVVRPSCGLAVAFYAGNYHGVQAVTSGQRCALAMWFTLDKRFDEEAYNVARKILRDMGKPLGPPLDSGSHGGEL